MTFFLPALPSSRLPQSLQKMREPMADMAASCLGVSCEEKVTGTRETLAGSFRGWALMQLRAVRRAKIVQGTYVKGTRTLGHFHRNPLRSFP